MKWKTQLQVRAKQIAVILCAMVFPHAGAYAQEVAIPLPQAIEVARNALGDGLPDVAVATLRPHSDSGALVDEAHELFVQALARSGGAGVEEALGLLGEDGSPYWRGVALSRAGRFPEAVDAFLAELAIPDSKLRGEAGLSGASMLVSIGRQEEAKAVLVDLLGKEGPRSAEARIRLAELFLAESNGPDAKATLDAQEEPWEDRLVPAVGITKARAHLLLGDPASAEKVLAPLLAMDRGLSTLEFLLVRLEMADAKARLGNLPDAVAILTELVEDHPESPYLDRVFDRFGSLGVLSSPALEERMTAWANSEQSEGRAVLARFSLAFAKKLEGAMDEALEGFTQVSVSAKTKQSLVRRSLLEMAEICATKGDLKAAKAHLKRAAPESVFIPELRARISTIVALIEYKEGDFLAATESFSQTAAAAPFGENRIAAAVNAALSSVRSHDEAAFRSAFGNLIDMGAPQSVRAQVDIDRAILAAAFRQPGSQELLAQCLRDHPDHIRAAEVELVLAETHLLAVPLASPQAAAEHLQRAIDLGLSGQDLLERADYISVWIAEASGEDPEMIAQAVAFLEKWPESQRSNRIRMRLAEVYDRNQDYPNAETQYELLADALDPEDPLGETALFFAGRAAMSLFNPEGLDKAVEIFGRVVERDGDLAPLSRLYQAKAKRRLGREDEALALLEVLSGSVWDREIRKQAMVEKVEALLVLAGSDPALFETAEGAARFLREEFPEPATQLRAAYLICTIRERVGDIDGAIQIGYEAMAIDDRDLLEMTDPASLNWLYRVGFTCYRLLESQGRHEAAVSVLERMGRTRGSRSEDAREKAEKLRLKHFLWEDKGI